MNNISEKHILLIEDNSDDAILTMRALEKVDIAFNLHLAKSGSEALKLLLDHPSDELPRPDVILLDLNLPDISGIEVLKSIKSDKRTKRIPVIILTSSTNSEDIYQCMEFGANSYIQKSVDFVEFVEIANLIGKYWLLFNKTDSI